EIAAREQLPQSAAERRVDGLRFLRQRTLFEDPQDEAVHRECRQAAGPDLEMHPTLLWFWAASSRSELGVNARLLYLSRAPGARLHFESICSEMGRCGGRGKQCNSKAAAVPVGAEL